jgi:two-component system CheB/CheR fusion protein
MVLFSKHDLTKNPPFLKLDLISCRNLLIYFNATLQQQVIPLFHYALLNDAYLFLGKSESVSSFTDLFGTVDAKNKIFIRRHGSNLHTIKFSAFKNQQTYNLEAKPSAKQANEKSLGDLVKETLYNTFEHPYVVVDDQLDIQEIHGDVRLFITLNSGSMQINLVKMVNQELQIELRTLLTKLLKHKDNLKSEIKRFELFGNTYYVRIHARPLIFNESTENLYLVIFEKLDINEFISKGTTDSSQEIVNEKITELEQELTATKEHLQTYIEEIETSNEELQSLNEELQSTNEELQSSNEELETSNEELQSTNEEIQITYAELKLQMKN